MKSHAPLMPTSNAILPSNSNLKPTDDSRDSQSPTSSAHMHLCPECAAAQVCKATHKELLDRNEVDVVHN